jgi:membrane protease YdiL (CAAX protease family)
MEHSNDLKIRPMGLPASLLFFGIPSAVFYFCIYYVMQRLHQDGVNDFMNFFVTMASPPLLMLLAALIAFRLEGNNFKWSSVSARFRLRKMTRLDWIYAFGLLVVMILLSGTLSFTSKWLIQFRIFSPPEFLLPAVDPRLEQSILVDSFMGFPLKGQWWIAVVYLIALIFNIIGEEFWWRGYIFPRQELAFKKWTWLVHGTLGGLFHIFWKWNLIILFPTCIAVSWVIYRRKNTWIGIITHIGLNSIPLISIILGIIG